MWTFEPICTDHISHFFQPHIRLNLQSLELSISLFLFGPPWYYYTNFTLGFSKSFAYSVNYPHICIICTSLFKKICVRGQTQGSWPAIQLKGTTTLHGNEQIDGRSVLSACFRATMAYLVKFRPLNITLVWMSIRVY